MRRRDFLKSALAAGGALSAPAIWSPAKAQSRQETLLIVSESGPNNVDIHGIGTNVPGYEVSWNCYDRLISHEMKTVNGTPYYDKDKFKGELADDMKVGEMTATFKLNKNATFQDGTDCKACQMVARSRGVCRRIPNLPDGCRLADQARAVRGGRRSHVPCGFCQEGSPHRSRPRGDRALGYQFGTREEARDRERSVGTGIHQAEHGGGRGLSRRELDRRHRSHPAAQWQVGGGAAPEGEAYRLAHRAISRQSRRAARTRRCRHLV